MSELPINEQQTPRYVEKREAILDAAARLFNRRGVRGTTLSDVAQSVGLVTNSVTYYYRKKEDLALACSLRAIATLEQLLVEAGKARDPGERVRALLVGYFRVLAEIEAGESGLRSSILTTSQPSVSCFRTLQPPMPTCFDAFAASFVLNDLSV